MRYSILIPVSTCFLIGCAPKPFDNPSYKISESFKLNAFDGKVTQLTHKKSGAGLVLIKNKDQARGFTIAFKTPPYNDTGLFHIFEHAVLAGSRLYPSKSTFFNVSRSSVASFINAMTGSVNTYYPFVTRDPEDFDNLLSVYMDAVFFPKAIQDPRIIKREGWRYETHSKTKTMSINGIVFNEMKGAYSSPRRLLWLNLNRSLLPQTPYAYSSGGFPEKIATLTFEQIVEAHKKYYHPQNSLIILYGDIDFPKTLDTIDKQFLSHFRQNKKFKSPEIALQKDFNTSYSSPVTTTYPGPEKPKKDFAAKGYVLGKLAPLEEDALSIMLQAFVSNNIAPLKLRTLKEGLATSVFYQQLEGRDNALAFIFEGTDSSKLKTLEDTLQDEINTLAQKGLDQKFLTSILNKFEFSYKEKNHNSKHKGLFLFRVIQDHWLYPDRPLAQAMDIRSRFKKLRKLFKDKLFVKNFFQKHFQKNLHSRWIIMKPDPGFSKKFNKSLAQKITEALKVKSFSEYEKEDKLYREWVSAKETEEITGKTPLLKLSNIKVDEKAIPFKKYKSDFYEVIEYPQSTGGISYINFYFDLQGVKENHLKNLNLFKYLLKKVNTNHYSFQELSQQIDTYMGRLNFRINTYQSFKDTKKFKPFMVVHLRFLNENSTKSMQLLKEVLIHSQFSQEDRIQNLLDELKTKMSNSIPHRAMGLSQNAAHKSFFPLQGAFIDEVSGGSFEEYILSLKEGSPQLLQKFKTLLGNIFNQKRLHLVTMTTDQRQLKTLKKEITKLNKLLPAHSSKNQQWAFATQKNYEGYVIPGEVQYLTEATSFEERGLEYDGALIVYSKYLNQHFMLPQLREQSGAYGAWSSVSRNKLWTLQTYRDPHLKKSFDIFSQSVDFMKKEKLNHEKLKPSIIGSLKTFYRDRSVSEKTGLMTYLYLSDLTWEDYIKTKKEILETKSEDFQKISQALESSLKKSKKAAAGKYEKIKKDAPFLKEILSFL